jgi:predicted oxidoreductase
MERRELTGGIIIPVLGLGTWGMGGRESPDKTRDRETVATIRMALELGLTHIDTAEYYGAGHAEELVGEAIEGWDREKLFITSKVWHNHLHKDDLHRSMRASLKRLGVDQVDLYLVHWPNPDVPLAETMEAMEECVKGHTRFIGLATSAPSSGGRRELPQTLNSWLIRFSTAYSTRSRGWSSSRLPTNGRQLTYRPLERCNNPAPNGHGRDRWGTARLGFRSPLTGS